jgi:phage shock protein B
MEEWAVVAIVAIVFGFLYRIVRLIAGGTGRSSRSDKDSDEGTIHSQRELFDLAMRLQNRVETLERVLDSAQPEWRGKP